jgi:hypothetical protein
MRCGYHVVLVTWVALNDAGCGARTGLYVDEGPLDRANGGDGGESSEGTGAGGGPFCALHMGPVSTCQLPASDGAVQQCDATFSHCVNVDGQWGCCTSESGNNGSGGSCRFAGPIDPCAIPPNQGVTPEASASAGH